MVDSGLDITVIITTYNRADTLQTALESMAGMDREGISVEFVVVDNNSTDNTRGVVESFGDQMPIRYLFEGKQGKSYALNRVLDDVALGKIVVFTDDDVLVERDWLHAILRVCERWPTQSAFGGRILPFMPEGELPAWAHDEWIQKRALNRHELAEEERVYPHGKLPNGANFWVRREILSDGRRFDESYGPRGADAIAGYEDVEFYTRLVGDGYEIVYSPEPCIRHLVRPDMLTWEGMRRRACMMGHNAARIAGLWRKDLLNKWPAVWFVFRLVRLMQSLICFGASYCALSSVGRMKRAWEAWYDMSHNMELIRAGRNALRNQDA